MRFDRPLTKVGFGSTESQCPRLFYSHVIIRAITRQSLPVERVWMNYLHSQQMVNYSIDWVLSAFQYYNAKYSFRMMDLIETEEGSKHDPWLEKIASVQHIAALFKVRKGHRKRLLKRESEADDKWEGSFLSLMRVLQFIPTRWKKVHSVRAVSCNSTQIWLRLWKEILFSSRHLWPGVLRRLTSERSAKIKLWRHGLWDKDEISGDE